jgi:hypothetical protein
MVNTFRRLNVRYSQFNSRAKELTLIGGVAIAMTFTAGGLYLRDHMAQRINAMIYVDFSESSQNRETFEEAWRQVCESSVQLSKNRDNFVFAGFAEASERFVDETLASQEQANGICDKAEEQRKSAQFGEVEGTSLIAPLNDARETLDNFKIQNNGTSRPSFVAIVIHYNEPMAGSDRESIESIKSEVEQLLSQNNVALRIVVSDNELYSTLLKEVSHAHLDYCLPNNLRNCLAEGYRAARSL